MPSLSSWYFLSTLTGLDIGLFNLNSAIMTLAHSWYVLVKKDK
jgi:hypothetical protein